MADEVDVIDEYTKHAILYFRAAESTARDAGKFVKESDLLFYEAIIGATGALTLSHRVDIRRIASEIYRNANKEAKAAARDTILDLSAVETSFQEEALAQQVASVKDIADRAPIVKIAATAVAAQTLDETLSNKKIDEWIKGVFDTQARTAAKLLVNEMIIDGKGAKATARKLHEELVANAVTPLDINRRNAEAIVRGYSSRVANNAREQVKNANKDILEYELWTSTLDHRTSSTCRIRSEKKYTLEGAPIGHDIPYRGGPGEIHWGCRSVGVLTVKGVPLSGAQPSIGVGEDYKYNDSTRTVKRRVGKGEEPLTEEIVRVPTRANSTPKKSDPFYKKNPDKYNKRKAGSNKLFNAQTADQKVASIGKQKANDDTYNTFLRRQYNKGDNGKAFVADVLGPTRAKLFGEGKLDISRFHIDNLTVARDVLESRRRNATKAGRLKLPKNAEELIGEQFTVKELKKKHPNIWNSNIGEDNSYTQFKAAK